MNIASTVEKKADDVSARRVRRAYEWYQGNVEEFINLFGRFFCDSQESQFITAAFRRKLTHPAARQKANDGASVVLNSLQAAISAFRYSSHRRPRRKYVRL